MSKKNFAVSILVLASMVFATGCGVSSGGSGGGTGYLGGTQGLEMEFQNGAPPDYIFDNLQFDYDVNVKVENMGEIDVPDGGLDVSLLGIDLTLFGLAITDSNDGPLAGTYLDPEGNVIPGDVAWWNWHSEGYTGTVVGNTPYTIFAEACYTYGSEAQAFLCYKADDMLDTDPESICLIKGTKSVENARSPIQITRLSEGPQGSSLISFTFEIAHVGNGQLYLSDGAPACLSGYETEDTLTVTVDTGVTGSSLSCSFPAGPGVSGDIKLNNDRFTLRCTETVPAGSNWESLVTISTSYDYKNKIQKQLVVKASG